MMGGSHLFIAIYVLVTHGPMVPHCARITNYNRYETSIFFSFYFTSSSRVQNPFKTGSNMVLYQFKISSNQVQTNSNQFKTNLKPVPFYRSWSL